MSKFTSCPRIFLNAKEEIWRSFSLLSPMRSSSSFKGESSFKKGRVNFLSIQLLEKKSSSLKFDLRLATEEVQDIMLDRCADDPKALRDRDPNKNKTGPGLTIFMLTELNK